MHDMACTIVTTFGSTGDLNPFVALGLALRSNGHDALFAVEANFGQLVSPLGFPVRVLTGDQAEALGPSEDSFGKTRVWVYQAHNASPTQESHSSSNWSIGVILTNHTDYRKEPEAKVGEGASTAVKFWKKAESCGRHLHLWAGHHLAP